MVHDQALNRIYIPRTQLVLNLKDATIDKEQYPFARNVEDDEDSHWKQIERKTLTSEKGCDDEIAQYGQGIDSN